MFVPRPGLFPQRLIVQSNAFTSVVECLKIRCMALENRFENLGFSEEKWTGEGEEILKHLGYCMDVVEACAVCEEDALKSIDLLRPSLLDVFASLISHCHVLARHHKSKVSTLALDILIGCLRTMVNMTNYNSIWSEELSTQSVLEALCGLFGICREGYDEYFKSPSKQREIPTSHLSPQSIDHDDSPDLSLLSPHRAEEYSPQFDSALRIDEVVFDLLCVSLGLLANLLEESAGAKGMLKELEIYQLGVRSAKSKPKKRKSAFSGDECLTNGFDELIKLYVHPPCARLDEKKFIRGCISVVINLTLLDSDGIPRPSSSEKEVANKMALDDDEKSNQSINEIEIIKSFKKVFDQNRCPHRSNERERPARVCKPKRKGKGTNVGGARETNQTRRENIDGEEHDWETAALETRNSIIKEFIEDLKLHSSSIFNSRQPRMIENPMDHHAPESPVLRSTAAVTTTAPPFAFTLPQTDLPLDSNHHHHLKLLESSWNRLWVELI